MTGNTSGVTTPPHHFDPEDFLRLAERLVRLNNEAEVRTAIGRAYYAVFLKARTNLSANRFVQTGSARDHGLVAGALADEDDVLELGRLRQARNRADYRPDLSTRPRNARALINRARQLFARV